MSLWGCAGRDVPALLREGRWRLKFGCIEAARGELDLSRLLDVGLRAGSAKVFESAGTDEDARFQGTGCFVVAFDGFAETFAGFDEMGSHIANALVKLLSQVTNLFGIQLQLLLTPAVSDCFEQRDKGGGCRENDALLGSLLNKGGVLLESGAEKCLARK